MPPQSELNSTILTLLEENREDMKDLYACMYDTRDIIADLRKQFIGISPEDHIRDHAMLAKQIKDLQTRHTRLQNILTPIIAATVIAFGSWAYVAGYDIIKQRIIADYNIAPK